MKKDLQTNSTKVVISLDQTRAKSLRFGILTFVPTDIRFGGSDCTKCILKNKPECKDVPCTVGERYDELSGYWSKCIERLNENQQ